MNFSALGALWALPAAVVPLAMHWLSRRSTRRVRYSDLTLLAAIESRSRPRRRLRDVLLLAARTLLILSLILAAAGPSARGSSAAAAGEGVDMVLLLDASYSMRARDGGRTRFDAARDAGRRLLKRLKTGDRAAVGVFAEGLEKALSWENQEAGLRALSSAIVGHGRTNAAGALSAARDLLESSPRGSPRVVVVLGDGAAHMLTGPVPRSAEDSTLLGLEFKPLTNGWITSIAAAPGSSAREPSLEIRAMAAGADIRTTADLWVEESRGASTEMRISSRQEARQKIALPPAANPRDPFWNGHVALREDALPEDDVSFFSMRHPAAARVLVLYADATFDRAGRAGWYLRQLFGGGDRSLAGREADFLAVARWQEADFAHYGTILLPDAGRLPPALSSALERFAAAGAGVWIIPGIHSDLDSLDRLSSWLPARFGQVEELGSPRGLRVVTSAAETQDWDELALGRISFGRKYRLEPSVRAATWLADSGGAPLLVTGAVGRGRAVVWAVPLDADWTNLGLKPAFIPWAAACLSLAQAKSSEDASHSAHIGETLMMKWGLDQAAPDRVTVRAPDGRSVTIAVRERRAKFSSTEVPGLYQFAWANGGRATYAVNVDPSRGESDLTPAASPPWTKVTTEDIEDVFDSKVFGQDLRGWFLALAAAALLAEMFLSLPAVPALVAAVCCALFITGTAAWSQQGDRFVWNQLQLGAGWDPYPEAPARVLELLSQTTSARVASDRRLLTVDDVALFSSPFVYLAGREAPSALGDAELRRFRQYLAGGGFLWIEDSTGGPPGSFDRWVRKTLAELSPQAELRPLPSDHVLYRTFFLLRGPAGRVAVSGAVEGVQWGGRVAVLYSRDDVLGAWAKDAFGRPLKSCVPGGEPQRVKAQRLTLNILMYAMTGSYKADAVHQSAILEKLRGAVGP